MYPFEVVVRDVAREKPPEVPVADNDYVIEELTPTGSHPSLGERVLTGTAVRRSYGLDPKVPERGGDLR